LLPPTRNLNVDAPGSRQVGPRSLTISVAIGTNFVLMGPDLTEDLATAGDCPVSATIVASKLAATSPVTRRRFPLNIALRIDKSTTNDFLMVTEDFQCQSPTVGN
jgi:hypothetical protein